MWQPIMTLLTNRRITSNCDDILQLETAAALNQEVHEVLKEVRLAYPRSVVSFK